MGYVENDNSFWPCKVFFDSEYFNYITDDQQLLLSYKNTPLIPLFNFDTTYHWVLYKYINYLTLKYIKTNLLMMCFVFPLRKAIQLQNRSSYWIVGKTLDTECDKNKWKRVSFWTITLLPIALDTLICETALYNRIITISLSDDVSIILCIRTVTP